MAAQQQQTTAIARQEPAQVTEILRHKYTEPDEITRGMDQLRETYNVLSPVRQISTVPIGHALTLSVVSIDADGDTYKVDGGKLALSKSALDRIATAVGVSWNPRYSGRLDDGSDPNYAHYKAVGEVVDPDGTKRTICGEKVMDLRDGSEQAKAAGNGLKMQRAHILSHAETKAKLRAIRSAVGVRSSYTPEQVRRPFVAVKLVETGKFGDPELDREYARLKMRKMLGVTGPAAALYGPPSTMALPAPDAVDLPQGPTTDLRGPAQHAPPPIGMTRRHERDGDDGGDGADADDGGPVDTERGGDPIRFFELPPEAQLAELVGLAEKKGKLGDGPGQMSKVALEGLNDQQREKCWGRLCQLPDVALAPATDANGQVIPDWMR